MAALTFKRFPALILRRGSPAERALMRIVRPRGPKPGQVIVVNDEEFESLSKDAIAFDVAGVDVEVG